MLESEVELEEVVVDAWLRGDAEEEDGIGVDGLKKA